MESVKEIIVRGVKEELENRGYIVHQIDIRDDLSIVAVTTSTKTGSKTIVELPFE